MQYLNMAHDGWRYLVLIALIIAVIKYVVGWLGNRNWDRLDRQIGLLTTIVVDFQILLGLVLWTMRSRIVEISTDPLSMMEHPTTMLLAVIVMHIGWSRTKKAAVGDKPRTATITFILAGLFIALGVFRITIGR